MKHVFNSATNVGHQILVGCGAVLMLLLLMAAPAAAHDEIESSVPPAGSTITEPISEVTINFGAPVEVRDVRLFTDDIDAPLPATFEVLTPTSIRVDFELLTVQDTYIVRYVADEVATAEEEGHLLAGAVSFTYGEGTAEPNLDALTRVLPFAVLILCVGAVLSFRRSRIRIDQIRSEPVD